MLLKSYLPVRLKINAKPHVVLVHVKVPSIFSWHEGGNERAVYGNCESVQAAVPMSVSVFATFLLTFDNVPAVEQGKNYYAVSCFLTSRGYADTGNKVGSLFRVDGPWWER